MIIRIIRNALVVVVVCVIASGCGRTPAKELPEVNPKFPDASIKISFLQPTRKCIIIPAPSKPSQQRRGTCSSAATSDTELLTVRWEYVGRTYWESGDVYLLKLSDRAEPNANWTKPILYNGTSLILADTDKIRIEMIEDIAQKDAPDKN